MAHPGDLDTARVLTASAMAVVAMTSLILGAAIGTFAKPSQKTVAIIMAFGTGALIQALALELAYEGAERLIHEARLQPVTSWMWVALGFVCGGIAYYLANRWIDQRGGALRQPATAKLFLLEKKREESAALLSRLSSVELLRSLPPQQMEEVLQCVEPVRLKAGEVLFRQGEAADALYLIEDGLLNVFADSAESEKKPTAKAPLAQLGPGQSCGEMALLAGEPRSATAIARHDTSLLRIDKAHFDALMQRSPALRQAVEELNSQRLLQNVQTTAGGMDAARWQKLAVANIQRLSRSEQASLMKKHAAAGAPLAIFMGAMLDGIPESVVIGSSFVSLATYQYTFLAAVFLSNLPEAMASAFGMKEAGYGNARIFLLWTSLVLAGAIAAALGNAFLSNAPPTMITLVEAIAGGGILAMVASVMMPEAYEHGGPEVGLATIAGFLVAFLFMFV